MNKSTQAMRKAWEMARNGQRKFGGKVLEYFSQSLKMAWALVKKQISNERGSVKFTATCSRCGQSIKYTYEYQGKVYGSECVQIVSGIKPSDIPYGMRNIDEYIRQQEATKTTHEQYKNKRLAVFDKNKFLIEYLFIKNTEVKNDKAFQKTSGFIHSMINTLLKKDIKEISDRQYEVLQDVFAKDFGKRKMYDAACDLFAVLSNETTYTEAIQNGATEEYINDLKQFESQVREEVENRKQYLNKFHYIGGKYDTLEKEIEGLTEYLG